MKFEFLGTGAADYHRDDTSPARRRYTSTLVDDCLLIDGTDTLADRLDAIRNVPAMIFTHSHSDHFDKPFLDRVAPERAFAEASWAAEANAEPVYPGRAFAAAGFEIVPVTSSHSTKRADETALNYILCKDGERVLYATDGAWLTNSAYHSIKNGAPLDAAIFDGTVGDDFPNDWRVFEHNTLPMVRSMRLALTGSGLLKAGAPVIVTHLARTLHPAQDELERREKEMGGALIIAYDGMVFDTKHK